MGTIVNWFPQVSVADRPVQAEPSGQPQPGGCMSGGALVTGTGTPTSGR